MGLFKNDIVDLFKFFNRNGTFEKSLVMIGKQDIYISKHILMSIVNSISIAGFNRTAYESIIAGNDKIDSYDLFYMIGFKEVHAIDISEFEGADIIWNLNENIPADYVGRFDYVLNGGTLEHIFDIAKAMNNITKLVKVGGSICHIAPAAGWVNHGFYSISPTFYIDFYLKNGFLLDEIRFEFLVRKNPDIDKIFSIYSEDIRLIEDSHDLNKHIKMLQSIDAIDEILLICYATRNAIDDNYHYPLQKYYEKIYRKYERNGISNNNNIDFCILANDMMNLNGRTALYGCGKMFDLLLDELFKLGGEKSFELVFDKDARKCGVNYRGVQVVYPTKHRLLEDWNNIIICSIDYEREIHDDIKNIISGKCNIITLSDYRT